MCGIGIKFLIKMVRREGIEPSFVALEERCVSTTLPAHKLNRDGKIRTCDFRAPNATL